MGDAFEKWRECAAERPARGPLGFDAELRAEALRLVREATAAGMSRSAVAKRLGITETALRRWEGRKRQLVPVRIVDTRMDEKVRLTVGPMVAELSVAQLAELARRLW